MSTWSLFFGWPAGGTWSNLVASLEWVAVAAVFVWLFRDRIGRHLAAWWHKHHGQHQRADFSAALAEAEERLKAHVDQRLTEHHGRILSIVQGEKRRM